MRARRLTTLLVSTSLLVVAAGCGSAADGPAMRAAVPPATDAPVPAGVAGGAAMLLRAVTGVGSRSVAVEMTVDGDVVATGALDPADRRARVTVDLDRLAGPSGSSARSLPAGLAPTGTVDAVVDGATAYLRPGSLGPVLGVPADRPWIRVAADALGLDRPGPAGTLDVGTLDVGGLDLPSVLASLGRIAGATRDEGPDTVRGVATTRYSLPVPAGDDRTVPVLVWLDAEALPRRIELRAPDGRNVRIEAFDWGRPVEVTVPAPATTVELRDLPLLRTLVDRLVAARSARGSGSD